MVNAKDILELVELTRWSGMSKGKVRAMKHFQVKPGVGSPTAARMRYLEEASQVPTSPRPTYVHPANTPTAFKYRREEGAAELTPAELVWLQRLPLDPKDVTHTDAARLAGMYSSLSRMEAPSSHQLVESVWLPVKELHDLRLAEQELAAAREGLPPVPASVAGALAEAVQAEHEDWPEAAVNARAEELLAASMERRERDHARLLSQAEAKVSDLKQSAATRVALVHDTTEHQERSA